MEFLSRAYRRQIFEGKLSLCRLWVLADKLGVRELQNLVISQFSNRYTCCHDFVDKETAVLSMDWIYFGLVRII